MGAGLCRKHTNLFGMVLAGFSEVSQRFLGNFLKTFGKRLKRWGNKSTRDYGIFEYSNKLSAMMNFCAID